MLYLPYSSILVANECHGIFMLKRWCVCYPINVDKETMRERKRQSKERFESMKC